MNATDVKKNDNIIQFDHVTFQYNKEEGKPIQVLKDISLEIQAGSFVAVLGHNGCGKSTLAKHMNAILLPSGGTVYVRWRGHPQGRGDRLEVRPHGGDGVPEPR